MCNTYRPAKVKNLQYLGGTLLGNIAAEAQTSDVGKMKSAFWRRQSFTSSSCQHTDMRLSAQHHLALTRLVWITLFHSLFHSFAPFPLCSAYYHHTVRREWFKTYAFQFKKLMLGLGRSLFSHLWPSGGSAQRLKKQVSSPLSSLMLCFADNKLKWKADSEINITEQRIPGKTCMTDKVINMPDGQYRQGAFFPPQEKVDHTGKEGPQPAQEGYRPNDDTAHLHQFTQSSKSRSVASQYGNCTLVIFGLPHLARACRRRLSSRTFHDRCWIRPVSKTLKK